MATITGICVISRAENRRPCWPPKAQSSMERMTPAYQRFIGTMCRLSPSTLNNSMNQTGAGSPSVVVVFSISVVGSIT